MILLIALAVLLGSGYFFTPQLMAAAARSYQDGGNQEAAMILKERLIRYFPQSNEARDEAFSIGDRILSGESRIVIGPNFTGGGVDKNVPVSTEKAISYLERVTQAQGENLWKYNGFTMIGKLYKTIGDYKQSEHWLNLALQGYQSLKRNDDWKTAEVSGSLIEIYLETEAYAKAMALIHTGMEKYTQPFELSKFYSWQGDVYYAQGDYVQAKPSYTKALEMEEINWQNARTQPNDKAMNINATLEQQPGYRYAKARLSLLESMQGSGGEQGRIAGEIREGTSPMSNVQVNLINEKEYDGRMSNLKGVASQLPVITDARGKFSFTNVPPGRYFVVLGFVPQDLERLGKFKGLETFTVKAGETVALNYTFEPRVNIVEPSGKTSFQEGDKMTIAWQAVPDAASYNLNLTLKIENGYVSSAYKTGLKDTSYVFAPRGLELREMNFVTFGDSHRLGPSAILGSFYPGARIFFQVEAFDQEGRSISDSEGYVMQLGGNYPSVEITGTAHFSAGDKLVQEKKFEEAVTAYKTEAAQDPGDVYALLSLARLYHYGWAEGTSDLQQAVAYYKKLLALTGEHSILEEAATAAGMAHNYQLALQIFTSFEDRMEPQSFWFHWMGEMYFLAGQPEKAITYYLKFLDGKDEMTDLEPVIAMLYVGDYQAALNLLQTKTYPETPRNPDGGQSEKAADTGLITGNLQRYVRGAPSKLSQAKLKTYLNEIMQITGSNRSAQVKAFQDKVRAEGENDPLVQTLLELVRDRY
ncbi:MAG: hypothetical protein GX434_04500 [Peptococcaceae bacterium]|nr:hypothetical protein [Peptococcaceae bacterium]